MGSDSEPAKLLLPYLQRADELQKHEPLVAYYCRLYAMERGLKIPAKERTKTTNALLVSLMNQLEKDKKSLKLGSEDSMYLEGFASNVFAKADKQDRAGRADLNTAKTFYAASIFFEIVNQFGELQPDLEQKQKYAVWKAADIRKALKEGRKPEPGPPGGEKDMSNSPAATYDLGQNESIGRSESFAGSQPRVDASSRPVDDIYTHQPSYAPSSPGGEKDMSNSPAATSDLGRNESIGRSESFAGSQPRVDASSRPVDDIYTHQPSSYAPTSPYPSSDYPTHDFQSPPAPPPPANRPENSAYHHPYQHTNVYSQDHSRDHNYPSSHVDNYTSSGVDSVPYNYANFQSYPTFNESTLPATSGNYPSRYQGSNGAYSQQHPGPEVSNYPVTPPYNTSGVSETDPGRSSQDAFTFSYDINYKPPAEKISEAHKAAKFAVGALAFDDVTVAVDFLKQALELLTNPTAGH